MRPLTCHQLQVCYRYSAEVLRIFGASIDTHVLGQQATHTGSDNRQVDRRWQDLFAHKINAMVRNHYVMII
jgi:hypothetical protein